MSNALKTGDTRLRVSYFYDPDIGSYYYGPAHPMKPQRIRMAHSLILSYGLYKHLDVYKPHEATHAELAQFHDSEYISFLRDVNSENRKQFAGRCSQFNLNGYDCPIFDGVLEFQSACAGASVDCAIQLNHKHCDIAINWSGGLHHAKRAEAAGFCYINDIVLGILELLKYHTRVLYIDIDIHHGDGVEEAFYLCDRVMTASFHKYGDFFPGTGDVGDVGAGRGKHYSVNVPLDDGINDETYVALYKSVINRCVEVFRPEAIVLQCGADSITGDRLGNFNMTTRGHGECVAWTKSLGLPLMVLGGGGYTIRNVARAWLYETGVCLGLTGDDELANDIPYNEYYEYYGPDHKLHLEPDPTLANSNTQEALEEIRLKVFKHLNALEHAPSVQFAHVPCDFFRSSAINDSEMAEYHQGLQRILQTRKTREAGEQVEDDGGDSRCWIELQHRRRRLQRLRDELNYDQNAVCFAGLDEDPEEWCEYMQSQSKMGGASNDRQGVLTPSGVLGGDSSDNNSFGRYTCVMPHLLMRRTRDGGDLDRDQQLGLIGLEKGHTDIVVDGD